MNEIDENSMLIERLAEVIAAGDCGPLEQLLDAGTDVNTVLGPRGRTLLTEAIAKNSTNCACLLIQRGAALGKTGAGVIPLAMAARSGNVEVCHALLDAGAPIDDYDLLGHTALFNAAFYDFPDVCRLLVRRGADPHIETAIGSLPLNAAVAKSTPESIEIVRILVDGGADPSTLPVNGVAHGRTPLSALHFAVMNGARAHIEHFLYERGVDPNHLTGEGRSPLELAGTPELEELLRSVMTEWAVKSSIGANLDTQHISRSKGPSPL
jgi:ankyrin repeat protein